MSRLAAAALAAALLAGAGSTAPAAAQDVEDAVSVRVLVTEVSPVLHRDGTLVLRGAIVNDGDEPFDDVQLRVHVGERVESRSELHGVADAPPAPRGGGTPAWPAAGVDPPDLPGRSRLVFAVDTPATDLSGLGNRPGVHPLAIEVRARQDGSRRRIGLVHTFLQWSPGRWTAATGRSRLAWVWPLVDASRRDAAGVYPDEQLAVALSPGGRLDELLDVAAGVQDRARPTWAVDPALVAAAGDLADGYEVRGPDGEPRDGANAEHAARWVRELGTALKGRPVLGLPYADPDVAALVHRNDALVVGAAVQRGRQVLSAAGLTQATRLAWPPYGLVDTDTLEVLAAHGARTVVVAEDAVPLLDPPNYTPTAGVPLSAVTDGLSGLTGLTGLYVDRTLERLVAEGAGPAGRRLAVQRFLAETALIALEQPRRPRDLVVAPPRRWSPDRAFARELLDLTSGVPWLVPATLPELAAREPEAEAETRFLSYSDDAAAAELPDDYLADVGAQRDRLGLYKAILARDARDPVPEAVEDLLLRAVSVRWRDDPATGRAMVRQARERLDGQFGQVRVSTGGLVTLTSDTGRIPVTIVNDLDVDVRVRVHVDTGNRLTLDEDAPVEQTVPRRGRTQLTLEGRAQRAGEFTIAVRLLTPDGKQLPGPVALLRVRSTAYGRVVLTVTIGAFGVFLAAGVARLVRRRRRSAAAAAAEAA